LQSSYDTISNTVGLSESDLAVLTDTLNLDLPDYARPDVELVASPIDNAAAPATQLTCLQLSTSDALSPSLAREIIGATFNGSFRAFFVSGHTVTTWRFQTFPTGLYAGDLGTGRGAFFRFT
jgi:hypothetical protein